MTNNLNSVIVRLQILRTGHINSLKYMEADLSDAQNRAIEESKRIGIIKMEIEDIDEAIKILTDIDN